jgi:uncharacterized protein (TIGR03067 family)
MQRFFTTGVGGLIAFSLLAAPVPKGVKKKTDEELLEGRWEIVTLDEGDGPKVPADSYRTFHFTYRAGVLNTGRERNAGWVNVKVTLDPTMSPRVMTLETSPGRFIKNIYEIDGDTLKWCEWQRPDPPTGFTGSNGQNCFVLKRATDEKRDK